MTASDADNLEHQEHRLSPAEGTAYDFFKAHPTLPITYKDIMQESKVTHGTARNILCRLNGLKLIRLYCRDAVAFYILSTTNPSTATKPMTLKRMTGSGLRIPQIDFVSFVESLPWEELCRVHDLHLTFDASGLYQLLLTNAGSSAVKSGSCDIVLKNILSTKNRFFSIALHQTGKVSVYVRCSNYPLDVSPAGLIELTSALTTLRLTLLSSAIASNSTYQDTNIPTIDSWVVSRWHYGRDTKQEVCGLSLNVTFVTWWGALLRVYTHHQGKTARVRIETLEEPRKSLDQAIADKLGLCDGCPWRKNGGRKND